MNKFRIISFIIILTELLLLVLANFSYIRQTSVNRDKLYLVEAKRVSRKLKECSLEEINLSDYETIVSVKRFNPDENCSYEYLIENIDNTLYRIEYREPKNKSGLIWMNIFICLSLCISIAIIIFIDQKILKPFFLLTDYSINLARGNLTYPINEDQNKFFGKFLWGLNMLRETLEEKKQNELKLQREKKILILSLSHDIKTPLSTIELYTKALKENLYDSEERRQEVLNGISKNINEIQSYINNITSASREDFIDFNVVMSEFYLSDIIYELEGYYREKLAIRHISFKTQRLTNCLLKGDRDRMLELLQNIMENAIKYGDGKLIQISYDDEEDCKLIKISNTGSILPDDELLHVFDSFYRGSNSKNINGSGLGLYIAKELMKKMDGDIFVNIKDNLFCVTAVVRKA